MTVTLSKKFFQKEDNRLQMKWAIVKQLDTMNGLTYSSLQVDADGFIKCEVSDKEKDDTMGELSHWKTAYVFFDGESLEELTQQFIDQVKNALKDTREKWEKAKEFHQKFYPDSQSTGRNRAIEFAKIYQEFISQL